MDDLLGGAVLRNTILLSLVHRLHLFVIDKVTFTKASAAINMVMDSTGAYASIASGIVSSTRKMSETDTMLAMAKNGVNSALAREIFMTKGLKGAELELVLTKYAHVKSSVAVATADTMAISITEAFQFSLLKLKTTFQALGLVMSSNPLVLGLTVLAGALTAFVAISHKAKKANEELRKAAAEAAQKYEETAKSINDSAARYEELHAALLEAKGDEQETYRIKKQLLELQDELNQKYGESYGKINLLSDAYKDHSSAITGYQIAAAKQFLAENAPGIEDAKKKMTEENTYTLVDRAYSKSESGKAVKDLAEKYGLDISEDTTYGMFSVSITANATDAKETITDFMKDLDKIKHAPDDYTVSNVKITSGNAFKKLKETILDDSGPLYKTSLHNEVISDSGKNDHTLSMGYNEATAAVEAYNEAVLKSSDPYNDKVVSDAYKHLQDVQNSIDSNSSVWAGYESVINDVFAGADTRILDFNNAIHDNKDGIGDLIREIKDMDLDDLDLKSMATDDKADDPFDRLAEQSLDEYDLGVEELISYLEYLGVVKGQIADEDLIKPKTKEEAISALNAMSEGFDQIDKIYSSIKGNDPFDFSLLDNNTFKDTFSGVDGYDDFIDIISSSPDDIEKCQAAFDNLTTSWIISSGILNNVNEETATLTTSMLSMMGVSNAPDVVASALKNQAAQADAAALEQLYLEQTGNALVDQTWESIEAFENQQNASKLARQALFNLQAAQLDLANNPINMDSSISSILSLAKAAKISGFYITALEKMEDLQKKKKENGSLNFAEQTLFTMYQAYVNSDRSWADEEIDFTPVEYHGKDTSKSSGRTSNNKSQKATEFDTAAESIKNLKNELDTLNSNLENTEPYSDKLTLIKQLIAKQQEYNEALKNQAGLYEDQYKKSLEALPQDLQDKITGNDNFGIDTIPAGLQEAVKQAQDYRDKWNSVNSEITAASKTLTEIQQKPLDLALAKLDNKIGTVNHKISDIENQMDEAEAMGLNATEEQYKHLLRLSRQEEKYNQNKLRGLYAQLAALDEDTDAYYECAGKIQDCEDAISKCAQNQAKWNKEMLELPIQYLEKANDELNDQLDELQDKQDDYDSAISGVTAHLQEQIDAQQKLRDEAEKTAEEQIDAVQKQIDSLQEANDKRKEQLDLEQKQYDLERAKNQKTAKVFREDTGDFVYEADQNAIHEAQDAYDDAVFNKQVSDLDDQIKDIEKARDELLDSYDNEIERLQEIMESWDDIAGAIQRAKDMAMANTIFGPGWEDRVSSGETGDLDNITGKYEENNRQQTWLEAQIEANEQLIKDVERYVEAWQMGEISIREARESINDIVSDIMPEIESNDERVNSISTYQSQWTNANQSVQADIGAVNTAAQLYAAQWAENVLSIGGSLSLITDANSTAATAESGFLQLRIGNLNSFKDTYLTLAAQIAAKCKEIVDACHDAEQAMDSLDDDGGRGSKGSSNGGGKGSSSGHWDSSDASHGPGVYADGILKGRIGGIGKIEKRRMLKYLATHDLKNGEVPIIAHKDEVVLNPQQQETIGRNLGKLSAVDPGRLLFSSEQLLAVSDMPGNGPIPLSETIGPKSFLNKVSNVSSRSMRQGDIIFNGDIQLPKVKDADSFARAFVDGSLKSAINQKLYKQR